MTATTLALRFTARAATLRSDNNPRRLSGLAAPSDTWTDIPVWSGSVRERIEPGAFFSSLAAVKNGKLDVRAFVDHDQSKLLARTRGGTLSLREGRDGLHFALDIPETTLGNDILAYARADLLSGVSIGFDMSRSDTELGMDKGVPWRILRDVALRELSIITGAAPAYAGTSVNVAQSPD